MGRPVLEPGRSGAISDHDENVHNARLLYGGGVGAPAGTGRLWPAAGW